MDTHGSGFHCQAWVYVSIDFMVEIFLVFPLINVVSFKKTDKIYSIDNRKIKLNFKTWVFKISILRNLKIV